MSKNLKKFADLEAYEAAELTNNSVAIIKDENGDIVGYKNEDGEVSLFQGGESFMPTPSPKRGKAVYADGTEYEFDEFDRYYGFSSLPNYTSIEELYLPENLEGDVTIKADSSLNFHLKKLVCANAFVSLSFVDVDDYLELQWQSVGANAKYIKFTSLPYHIHDIQLGNSGTKTVEIPATLDYCATDVSWTHDGQIEFLWRQTDVTYKFFGHGGYGLSDCTLIFLDAKLKGGYNAGLVVID